MELKLKDLSIDNAETIVLFPYGDVKEDEWPTYVNREGDRVPIPEGWRNVGYRYPYPEVKRVHAVRELSSGLSMRGSGEEVNIKTGDPEKLARHLSNNLIKSIVILDPGTSRTREQTLDKETREWLCGEFRKSTFLLSGAYLDYLREGGKTANEEEEEEEVFTGPSGSTG